MVRGITQGQGERSDCACDVAGDSSFFCNPVRLFPCDLCATQIEVFNEITQEVILEDFLEEFGILAAALLARVLNKKLGLGKGGGRKGVGFDNV